MGKSSKFRSKISERCFKEESNLKPVAKDSHRYMNSWALCPETKQFGTFVQIGAKLNNSGQDNKEKADVNRTMCQLLKHRYIHLS